MSIMKIRRINFCKVLVWMFLTVSVIGAAQVWAADPIQSESQQKEPGEELTENLELDQVQKMLDGILGGDSFSLKDGLKKLMQGEEPVSEEMVQNFLRNLFFSGLEQERDFFIRILLLILAGALLTGFASAFDNGQIADISFYVVYLVFFIMLMDSFYEKGRRLEEIISWMSEFMKALAPAYFMTVAASSGAVSAAVFYEGVLLLAWVIQWILLSLLLPGVQLYVLIRLVNHLSREEMLGKLAELLNTMLRWGLKTILGIVTGLQIIRNLSAPIMDSLKRGMIGKAAGALPGVGNAVSTVTEIVLTSAVLVRNCLGIMILLAFAAAGAGSVLHYGFLSLVFRFLAAVAESVSDRRVVECLSTMGEGFELFLKILFTAEILCMLTFLIIMAGVRGGSL